MRISGLGQIKQNLKCHIQRILSYRELYLGLTILEPNTKVIYLRKLHVDGKKHPYNNSRSVRSKSLSQKNKKPNIQYILSEKVMWE